MFSDLVFPQDPPIVAEWQPIFLEPIINSGEKITVLILIKDNQNKFTINRVVDESVLKFLYGKSSDQIAGLIEYLERTIKNPFDWDVPFDGVHPGPWRTATDFSHEGILQQALAQSSSLSVKMSNMENVDSKILIKDNNTWFHDVKNLVTKNKPFLMGSFNRNITIAKNITYEYNFAHNDFVANLLDFRNLHNQKAQTSIFKMQVLSNNPAIKVKQLILQMPMKVDLEIMKIQKKEALFERIDIFSGFLVDCDVEIVKVETAEQASQKLLKIAV